MRMRDLLCSLSLVFLTAWSASATVNWPEFRGPGGQGQVDAKNLPVKWSESENIAWKTPIDGKAWSSPVVWERTDFVCNHFRGAGSSPIIYQDLIILHFDGSDHQFVVAMNKKTGKTVWRTKRSVDYDDLDKATGEPKRDGDFRKGFATPLIVKVGGKDYFSFEHKGHAFVVANTQLWKVELAGESGRQRLQRHPDGFRGNHQQELRQAADGIQDLARQEGRRADP